MFSRGLWSNLREDLAYRWVLFFLCKNLYLRPGVCLLYNIDKKVERSVPMRICLNDGTWLHDSYDLLKWLDEVGISPDEMWYAMEEYGGVLGKDYDALEDAYHEQEMIADGYSQDLGMLIDEVEAIADRLKSGKKGKGYTKDDLAEALLYAVRCVRR